MEFRLARDDLSDIFKVYRGVFGEGIANKREVSFNVVVIL